jgi:hypothetical protein
MSLFEKNHIEIEDVLGKKFIYNPLKKPNPNVWDAEVGKTIFYFFKTERLGGKPAIIYRKWRLISGFYEEQKTSRYGDQAHAKYLTNHLFEDFNEKFIEMDEDEFIMYTLA